jgi:hypothetical protein
MSLVIRRAVIEPRYYCTKRKKQLFHNLILSKMHLFLNFSANWVWGRTVEFLLWGFIYVSRPGGLATHIFSSKSAHMEHPWEQNRQPKTCWKRKQIARTVNGNWIDRKGTVRKNRQ